jgi:hypothetical protein
MPTGRVLYVPETTRGRVLFLGQEIPVRADEVADDARRPGTRVRFDLTWEDDDLRASNVRRTSATRARERMSPSGRFPRVQSGMGPSALRDGSRGRRVEGGSER